MPNWGWHWEWLTWTKLAWTASFFCFWAFAIGVGRFCALNRPDDAYPESK